MPTPVRAATPHSPTHPSPEHSPIPLPDVYSWITEQIAAQIEAGVGRFRMPWHFEGAMDRPVNVLSRLPYRGANTLLLWTVAQDKGFVGGEWATYKQWQAKGAQVRKGEKATHIVFWKFPDEDGRDGSNRDAGDDPTRGNVSQADGLEGDFPDGSRPADRLRRRVLARTYPVFNADQVDGYTKPTPRLLSVEQKIAHAEEFLESADVTVRHGGSRAFYAPHLDEVVLPKFEAFRDPISYYAVRAHETIHATGHETRLHRQFGERYGDQAYAMEELTAELGAAFVCADLQLTNHPRKDHAQYAATWLKALRSDPRALFTAAGKAQQAADWLHDQHVQRFMPEEDYDQIGSFRRGGAFQRAAYQPGL